MSARPSSGVSALSASASRRLESDARKRFELIVADLESFQGVSVSRRNGFARGGLTINGKLFAILRGDTLLLKLPAPRVCALIDRGAGLAFDAGKGKPLKEWILIKCDPTIDWIELAGEGLAFVKR